MLSAIFANTFTTVGSSFSFTLVGWLAGTASVAWLTKYYLRRLCYTKLPGIPGPEPELFLGNIRNTILRHGTMFHAFAAMHQQHGDVFELFLGFHRAVVITDAKVVQRLMLKERDALEQNKWSIATFSMLMPYGVISLVGDDHRRHIRMLRPIMSITRLNSSVPLFNESLARLMQRWQSRSSDRPYHYKQDIQSLVFEQATRYFFGRRVVLLDDRQDGPLDIDHLTAVADQDMARVVQFTKAILTLSYANAKRVSTLNLRARIFGERMEVQNAYRTAVAEIERLQEEHRKATQSGDCPMTRQGGVGGRLLTPEALDSTNVIALMMESEEPFTSEEIRDEAMCMMFGSIETVPSTLGWVLKVMAGQYEVQRRLRQEILLLTNGCPYQLSGDQLQPSAAPYLDAVFRECMRLALVAPSFIRTTTRTITVGDMVIPPDVSLFFAMPVMHRDTRVWGLDAAEFRPERWLEADTDMRQLYSRHFFPFGSGTRYCFGNRLATHQVKLFLAALVCNVELHQLPSEYNTDDIIHHGTTSESACKWVKITPLDPLV